VPFCDHGAAETTGLGNTGSFLFCPGVAGAAPPPSRASGQHLCAMSQCMTVLEQGLLLWSLFCPVEAVGRPGDGPFTLAKALEQPEEQISIFVVHFNHNCDLELGMGRSGKASKPACSSPRTWCLQPLAGSPAVPAASICSAVL